MPQISTGVFTALTPIGPWPGLVPVSMYWMPIGRISSTSREGPSEMIALQPADLKAVAMLPPQRPFLRFRRSG